MTARLVLVAPGCGGLGGQFVWNQAVKDRAVTAIKQNVQEQGFPHD